SDLSLAKYLELLFRNRSVAVGIRDRSVLERESRHDIVPVIAGAVGKRMRRNANYRATDNVTSPVHKMAQLADDPASAVFLLGPVIPRKISAVYANVHDHWFLSPRKKL